MVDCHCQPSFLRPRLITGAILLLCLLGCHGPDGGGGFPATKIYVSELSAANSGMSKLPGPITVWVRNVTPQQNASAGTLTFNEGDPAVSDKPMQAQWFQALPAPLHHSIGLLASYSLTLHGIGRDGTGVYIILSGIQ